MKLTKLIAATAIFAIASSAFVASAATAAACTIVDGVVVTDGPVECVIAGPPMDFSNTPGSSSEPSMPPSDSGSTPMVTATPTPSATPTLQANPTPKPTLSAPTPIRKNAVNRHSFRTNPLAVNVNGILRIKISDLGNPKNETSCIYATSCYLDVPADHAWKFQITSEYPFEMGEGDGPYVSSSDYEGYETVYETATTAYPTTHYFKMKGDSPSLKVFANPVTKFAFTKNVSGGVTTFKSGAHTIPWNEPIAITPEFRLPHKINWKNVPPGLVEDERGELSGRPTQSGTYVLKGTWGAGSASRLVELTLIVGPGLTQPAGVSVAPVTQTTAQVSLRPTGPSAVVTKVSPALNPDTSDSYYEVAVRNTKTGEQTIQTFSGSETEGTIQGLIPDQTYAFKVRSASISSVAKSEYSSETTLKMPAAKLKYGVSGASVSGTQAWVKGTTDTILLTVKGKKSANISLTTPRGLVTPIEAAAFKKAFPKLSIDAKGKITGTITALTAIQKLYTVKVGSLLVKLNFVISR